MNRKPKYNLIKYNRTRSKKALEQLLACYMAQTAPGLTQFWLNGKWYYASQ